MYICIPIMVTSFKFPNSNPAIGAGFLAAGAPAAEAVGRLQGGPPLVKVATCVANRDEYGKNSSKYIVLAGLACVVCYCSILFCRGTLFNVFLPPLIQDLAIVGKTLFNVFWFWGPKNTGPNPDYPFQRNPQGLPGPTVPWEP